MIKNYALALVTLIALGLGISTYYYRNKPAQVMREPPLVLEKEVVVTKEVAKIVTKTETKKPDGTVIKEEKVEDKTVTSDKSAVKGAPKSKIRGGVKVHSGLDLKPTWEVTAGYRLGQSNVWVESGYNIQRKEAAVGLSIEF